MKSGQFSRQGLDAECPSGYQKVCEGSAAVLFPPAMIRGGANGGGGGGDGDDELNAGEDQAVFYNPAQVVNRDLSVCALQLFATLRREESRRKGGVGESGITILEALSATGLRAIRYFKEIEGVRYIIANDLDRDAVDCIRRNCAFNGIPAFEPGVYENYPHAADPRNSLHNGSGNYDVSKAGIVPNLDDAIDLMHRLAVNQNVHHYPHGGEGEGNAPSSPGGKRVVVLNDPPPASPATADKGSSQHRPTHGNVQGLLQQELMDVVDLDPYGTASPFLDAAFGCIKEGGLMLVTSTDSAILCGNYADTCHAKYNAVPFKGSHCHEMAVRILLGCIERVANKHKKYIVPLLSLHIDFYVRCFFRVYTQPAEVKLSPCKLGYQLQCTHCPAFWVRPMAFASARVTKAARRAATAAAKDRGANASLKRGRHSEEVDGSTEHGTAASPPQQQQDTAPPKGTSGEGEEEEEEGHRLSLPPPERCPAIPSRQDNPKLQCLSLQQLPAMFHSPASTTSPTSGRSTCPVCGVGAVTLSGPLYIAPTQQRAFLLQLASVIAERDEKRQITATARIRGLVQVAMEELEDCPLFYNLPDIASYVKTRCPPTPQFVAALARLGYRCSQVHCCAAGLKTDCPPEVLFSVMLTWKVRTQDEDARNEDIAVGTEADGQPRGGSEGSAKKAAGTLSAPQQHLLVRAFTPTEVVDFSYDAKLDFRGKTTGKAKFVPNAPGWGPKRRHQGARNPVADDGDGAPHDDEAE